MKKLLVLLLLSGCGAADNAADKQTVTKVSFGDTGGYSAVYCPPGSIVTGGGCFCTTTDAPLTESTETTDMAGWECTYVGARPADLVFATVYCLGPATAE